MNLYGYAAGDPINNSDPFGLCPYTNHTTDVSDCPDTPMGDAFRLLASHGGTEGASTIRLFAANRAKIVELGEPFLRASCKGKTGTACTQRQKDGSWLVAMLAGGSSIINATRATHEATHFFNADEGLAWRRALKVYRRLDPVVDKGASRGDYAAIDEGCRTGAIRSHYCP